MSASELETKLATLTPEKRRQLIDAVRRKKSTVGARAPISKRPAGENPLSYAQKRIWFLEQLSPDWAGYVMPDAFLLDGLFNFGTFHRSVNRLFRRHDVLRSTFREVNGEPVLEVCEELILNISLIDFSSFSEPTGTAAIREQVRVLSAVPMRLNETLIRVVLFRQSDTKHIVLLLIHHIVSDAWSVRSLILRELFEGYLDDENGENAALESARLQYQDYAYWQNEAFARGDYREQLAYWKKQLVGIEPLRLPRDLSQSGEDGRLAGMVSVTLSEKLSRALSTKAEEWGVTKFVAYLGTFQALLGRMLQSEDIAVGVAVAGRSHRAVEDMIGLFANTVVVRVTADVGVTILDWFERVQLASEEALRYQDVPFDRVVDELGVKRVAGENPLFEVMFTFQNIELRLPRSKSLALQVAPFQIDSPTAKLDFSLFVEEVGGKVFVAAEYNAERFSEPFTRRILDRYVHLLTWMAEAEGTERWQSFPGLALNEEESLRKLGTGERHAWPTTLPTIESHFEACVLRYPDRVAVVTEEGALTYSALDRRANGLAWSLCQAGIGSHSVVGVTLHREANLIIGLLGILKAGAAYLPMDPQFPRERLRQIAVQVRPSLILISRDLEEVLPSDIAPVWILEEGQSQRHPDRSAPPLTLRDGNQLAYVIPTSGSTGIPKGVQVEHHNVVNFFTGMDAWIAPTDVGVWFSVTSISFDISVLELFWTLTRGFTVVLQPDRSRPSRVERIFEPAGRRAKTDFSLFYFANDESVDGTNRYRLLLEGAKFADESGFSAVWTPERHFDRFGGRYPNPSVLGAALAASTKRIEIRAGSVVLPLHDPLRVAEEWAVVDQLSGGRTGLAFAPGWHRDDFVFAPERFDHRYRELEERLKAFRELWRGGNVRRKKGSGQEIEVEIFPKPVRSVPRLWLTSSGSEATVLKAGRLGLNLLTHLLGQELNVLREKIALYRTAWRQAGHPGEGIVTLMVHTYLGDDTAKVRAMVREPLTRYLESSVGLIQKLNDRRVGELATAHDLSEVMQHATSRYLQTGGLFGTAEDMLSQVERIVDVGVDEIACLIDFGLSDDQVLAGLPPLRHLVELSRRPRVVEREETLLDRIRRHQATHLQCTPSLARTLFSGGAPLRTGDLRDILIGGEPFPLPLAQDIAAVKALRVLNMYGPTETAVWSSAYPVNGVSGNSIAIGRPLHGNDINLVSPSGDPVPHGFPGEIWIGGSGVARGYWGMPATTAERFRPDPRSVISGGRVYCTGDIGRWTNDGQLEFLRRDDHQVKIRGYRIELPEIERALLQHPAVAMAVVTAWEREPGVRLLVGYVETRSGRSFVVEMFRRHLRERLPSYMVPDLWVAMSTWPQTDNGKIQRSRLPDPQINVPDEKSLSPRHATDTRLLEIWKQVLKCETVTISDNFFELGGDSILVIQVVSLANERGLALRATDLFQGQTIAGLSDLLDRRTEDRDRLTEAQGDAILLPTQQWFLAGVTTELNHYNQAVSLRLNPSLTADILKPALEALADFHDAFRLKFWLENGVWHQAYVERARLDFQVQTVAHPSTEAPDDQRERFFSEAQRGLSLEHGPIFRAVLMLDEWAENQLLLIGHHLVVDGVSWRILLHDLQTLCRLRINGQAFALGLKTASYQEWGRRLIEYTRTDLAEGHADLWSRHLGEPSKLPLLPQDFSPPRNKLTEETTRNASLEFAVEPTGWLLVEGIRSYGAHAHELLLAALNKTLTDWSGQESCYLAMEGHGREALFEGIDVSRTVGWFTSLYPVRLWSVANSSWRTVVLDTKEQVRGIPLNGLSYGLLSRFGTEPSARALSSYPEPEVIFNYLGQFDQVGFDEYLLGWGTTKLGPVRALDSTRRHLLEINGLISDGRLRIDFLYSPEVHRDETISQLLQRYRENLLALLAHCRAVETREWSPSDFPLARLDNSELARLTAAHPDLIDVYPLSAMQVGMLFHGEIAKSAGHYFQQFEATFVGNLDPQRLQEAWMAVIDRHAVLRSTFHWKGFSRPVQVVHRGSHHAWTIENWVDLPASEQTTRWNELLNTDYQQAFNESVFSPWRVHLIQISPTRWQFLLSYHHALLDGWSLGLVISEFVDGYRNRTEGRLPSLPLAKPFRSYIEWLEKEDHGRAEKYWRTYLKGRRHATFMRKTRDAPKNEAKLGLRSDRLILSAERMELLLGFARERQVTLNSVLQAAWSIVLGLYSGESEVMFGVTVSGRSGGFPGLDQMIGLFLNTLPVRMQVRRSSLVSDWLKEIQREQSERLEFEHCPLPSIQKWSEWERADSLFESVVIFENFPLEQSLGQTNPVLEITDFGLKERSSFPLLLFVEPQRELVLRIDYDADLFSAQDIGRYLERLKIILGQMIALPEATVEDLVLLPSERAQLTAVEITQDAGGKSALSLVSILQSQREHQPTMVGLTGPSVIEQRRVSLTYCELLDQVERVAAHLCAQEGWNQGDFVGVMIDRSVEMIVALLAVVWAGGVYVPIDPDYPLERVRQMLEDSAAPWLITEEQRLNRWTTGAKAVAIQQLLQQSITPLPRPVEISGRDLLYVIYTSGSSGRPKGVMIEHRNVVNFIFAIEKTLGVSAQHSFLCNTTISFDIFVLESLLPLALGAKVVLSSADEQREPRALLRLIVEEKVDVVQMTPSFLRILLRDRQAYPALGRLFRLLVGGEPLPPDLAVELATMLPDRVFNMYGPTETTVWSTSAPVGKGPVTIGRPLHGQWIRLLDEEGHLLPTEAPGQIWIGGSGVGRGYWKLGEHTRERFVEDPFLPGARLYRTGDLGVLTANGDLVCLGRKDGQVKIRGNRMELAEVELVARTFPSIRDIAFSVREIAQETLLFAYVVWSVPGDTQALRDFLMARLPDYMVPSRVLVVDAIPLTPNGKVDRNALLTLNSSVPTAVVSNAAPGSLEHTLLALWKEVLEIDQLSTARSFFELGGTSLMLMRLSSRISETLGREVGVLELIKYPSIVSLASYLQTSLEKSDTKKAEGASEQIEARRTGRNPLASLAGLFSRKRKN